MDGSVDGWVCKRVAGGKHEQTDKQMKGWQKSWINHRGRPKIIPVDGI